MPPGALEVEETFPGDVTALVERLQREFEGLKLEAYVCPAGVLTIGFGHTGPEVKPLRGEAAASAPEARRRRQPPPA